MSDTHDRWYLSGPLEVNGGIDFRMTPAPDTGIATPTWRVEHSDCCLRIADRRAMDDASGTERLRMEAPQANWCMLTVGGRQNGAIRVRHIYGKHHENDGDDVLYLNTNTGYRVHVGGPEKPSDLTVQGNVGIGMGGDTPQAKLEVRGDDNGGGDVLVTGRLKSVSRHGGGLFVDDGETRFVGSDAGDGIGFNNNGWQLVVRGDGNVGIGTRDARAKLHVNGGAIINGDININGAVRINGSPLFESKEFPVPSDNTPFNTGYSTAEWEAFVGGFETGEGDINEIGAGVIMYCKVEDIGGKWHVKADFRTHHTGEDWTVKVLFIKKLAFL